MGELDVAPQVWLSMRPHALYFVVGVGLAEESVESGQPVGLELEDELIDFANPV